jgi:protein-disulfide isomerase
VTSVLHQQAGQLVHEHDHVRGPGRAPVTLVKYSDFQCLHCGRAYSMLKTLLAELPDMFRLVFRHFPLVPEHPHAGVAARAAEAAARQGRFWQMHDALFENQRFLDADALRSYAETLGLDLEQFGRDLNDVAITARVERHIASGRASGVRGTPTLFLNGRPYGDAWDLDALRKGIMYAADRVRGLLSTSPTVDALEAR